MDKMKVEDKIDNKNNNIVTEQPPPLGALTMR